MLRGERVCLRALEPGDAATVWRWFQDHEVSQLDGQIYPTSLVQTEAWLGTLSQPSFRGVTLGIEAENGALIGYLSLTRTEPEDRSARFGILLGRDAWDQGYGTDATRTILRFAFTEMNLHRVELGVSDYNPRAQRVYEKCGFQVEGRRREARFHKGCWTDKIEMAILDREFLSLDQADQQRDGRSVPA